MQQHIVGYTVHIYVGPVSTWLSLMASVASTGNAPTTIACMVQFTNGPCAGGYRQHSWHACYSDMSRCCGGRACTSSLSAVGRGVITVMIRRLSAPTRLLCRASRQLNRTQSPEPHYINYMLVLSWVSSFSQRPQFLPLLSDGLALGQPQQFHLVRSFLTR
jgi:hypothetical protein